MLMKLFKRLTGYRVLLDDTGALRFFLALQYYRTGRTCVRFPVLLDIRRVDGVSLTKGNSTFGIRLFMLPVQVFALATSCQIYSL